MMAFCGVFWTTQLASRPVQHSPASLQLPRLLTGRPSRTMAAIVRSEMLLPAATEEKQLNDIILLLLFLLFVLLLLLLKWMMCCCAAGYMCARRLGGSPTVVWLTGPPHHSRVQQPYSLFPSCESSPLFHFRLLPPPSFLSFFWLSSSSSTHKPKGRRTKIYLKNEPPSQSFHQSVLFFAPSLFVLSSPFYFIFFVLSKKNPLPSLNKKMFLSFSCAWELRCICINCLSLLFARPMLVVHKKKKYRKV